MFVQHLPALGWEPVILTVDENNYEEELDWELHKLSPLTNKLFMYLLSGNALLPSNTKAQLTGKTNKEIANEFKLDISFVENLLAEIR